MRFLKGWRLGLIYIRFRTVVISLLLFLGFVFTLAVALALALPSGKAAPINARPGVGGIPGVGGSGPLPAGSSETVPSEVAFSESAPDNAGRTAEARETPKPQLYVIKPGDTLWSIARKFQLTASTLASFNSLPDPNSISPGRQLKIPISGGEVFHVVRSGETLWEIALRYGIEIDSIINLNPIDDPAQLSIGKKLKLPVAQSSEPDPVGAAARLASAQGVRGFRWPLIGTITSRFGMRDGRPHTGMDIAGKAGDPIRASKAGTVTVSGWIGGYGYTVIIRHNDGTASLYAHASELAVQKGQAVEAGYVIARVGSTGNSTGPHLHFEVIDGTKLIDPASVLP